MVVRVVGGQLVQLVAGQRGARMGDEAQEVVGVAGGASRREDRQAGVGSVPDQGEEGGKDRVRLVHRATPFRSGIRCESEGLRDSRAPGRRGPLDGPEGTDVPGSRRATLKGSLLGWSKTVRQAPKPLTKSSRFRPPRGQGPDATESPGFFEVQRQGVLARECREPGGDREVRRVRPGRQDEGPRRGGRRMR